MNPDTMDHLAKFLSLSGALPLLFLGGLPLLLLVMILITALVCIYQWMTAEKPRPVEKTRIIFVEGNISCGKSTLLTKIQEGNHKNVIVGFEPLEKWLNDYKTSEGVNILALFYEDSARWALTFQLVVLMCRFRMLKNLIAENPGATLVVERSIYTDYKCFALNLHLTDKIPLPEWLIYKEWFNYWESLENKLFDGCSVEFVYLRTPPDICYARISSRGRNEEQGIPKSYIEDIHTLHDDWLLSSDNQVRVINGDNQVRVISGLQSTDDVYNQFMDSLM